MSLSFSLVAPNIEIPIVLASSQAGQAKTCSLLQLLSDNHEEIIAQLRHYGAFLFRGFACQDEDYFSTAIELCALGKRCTTKDYDFPRTLLAKDIYTSSDLPPQVPLPLHHEKPRSKKPPHHLYFCCVTPAERGGGTIFANAEALWLDLPEMIRAKILKHGVIYKQFYHGQSLRLRSIRKVLGKASARCWSEYFGSDKKEQVEQRLAAMSVDWQWVNRGKDLVLRTKLAGALEHPLTKRLSWFNSAAYLNYHSNLVYGELKNLSSYRYLAAQYLIFNDMLPTVCHYGNGQAFSYEEIVEINRAIQKHLWVIFWQRGDFMIVDNFSLMHGKQPHEGERLLYSCMTRAD